MSICRPRLVIQLLAVTMLTVVLAACQVTQGTGAEPLETARRVSQALETVETYRYEATLRMEQRGPGDMHEQGEAGLEGAFQAPHRLHVRADGSGSAMYLREHEFLFDGERAFERRGGEWVDETGPGVLTMASAGPLPGEVAAWLVRAAFEEATEVSSAVLDGEAVLHVKGDSSSNTLGNPFRVGQGASFDVWIGEEDHLIRRVVYVMTTSISVPDSFSGEVRRANQEIRGEVRFFEYNAPVSMPAPGR